MLFPIFLLWKTLTVLQQLWNHKLLVLQSASHVDCNQTPLPDLSKLSIVKLLSSFSNLVMTCWVKYPFLEADTRGDKNFFLPTTIRFVIANSLIFEKLLDISTSLKFEISFLFSFSLSKGDSRGNLSTVRKNTVF